MDTRSHSPALGNIALRCLHSSRPLLLCNLFWRGELRQQCRQRRHLLKDELKRSISVGDALRTNYYGCGRLHSGKEQVVLGVNEIV